MMTPQQLTAHPIWGHFRARLDVIVNSMIQQGAMAPQEAQTIQMMMQQAGPGTLNFIGGLMNRYSSIDDAAMDAEIMNSFLPSIRMAAQQRMRMMSSYAAPQMMAGAGGMYAPGGMAGMMPGVAPVGFGYGPGFERPAMPASRGIFAPNGQGVSPAAAAITGPKPTTPAQKPPEPKKPNPDTIPYSKPVPKSDLYDTTIAGCVRVRVGAFARYDGTTIRRAVIHDPRLRYTSDQEAINAFKNIFAGSPKNNKKFMTVIYKKLVPIEVDKDEFLKLASAVSAEVLKADTLEHKLRAMVDTLNKVSVQQRAVQAYTDLVIEEFDSHLRSGALCDSKHPTAIFSAPNNLKGLLDLYTGDIDKKMNDALRGMQGFDIALKTIMDHLISNFVTQMPKFVLDPSKDTTVLDDFTKALPQVWSPDGNSLEGTDDLFDLFLRSKEVIDKSKTDTAIKAASELGTKLIELNKQFTVLYVNRVVSWCNYPKTNAVHYKPNGNCVPYVCSLDGGATNDLAYFCCEVLNAAKTSKMVAAFRMSPRTVYCEVDEETFVLDYSMTSDGYLWLGSSRYWV